MFDKISYLIAEHRLQHRVKVHMFCPACQSRLHLMRVAKNYVTLTEYASDPNADHPPKPAFACLNEKCELNLTTGTFFGVDGNLFTGPDMKERPPRKWRYAIGSISYHVEKEMSVEKTGRETYRSEV